MEIIFKVTSKVTFNMQLKCHTYLNVLCDLPMQNCNFPAEYIAI